MPAHEVTTHSGDDLIGDRESDVVFEENHLKFEERFLDILRLKEEFAVPDQNLYLVDERRFLPLPGGRWGRGRPLDCKIIFNPGGGRQSLRFRWIYLGSDNLLDIRGEFRPYILKFFL